MAKLSKYMQNKFKTYLKNIEQNKTEIIDSKKIKLPNKNQIIEYKHLPKNSNKNIKFAIIKLNGGMSTTMGGKVPKSTIKVKNNLTFLEITTKQIEIFNRKNKINAPLILMNSEFTKKKTLNLLKTIKPNLKIYNFDQHMFPRLQKKNNKPLYINNKISYASCGHGDIYDSLCETKLIDELLKQNINYVFISNIDNLSAIPDLNILNYMQKNKIDFILETTNKTKLDLKGGTPISYENKLRMLEKAIVPKDLKELFESDKYFKIFNTNNIWIELKSLKKLYKNNKIKLPLIINNKVKIINNKPIEFYQIETAMGDGISIFNNPKIINVPRTRFNPTKTNEDLLIKQSDLYNLNKDYVIERNFKEQPKIKFNNFVNNTEELFKSFKKIEKISLIECKSLEIIGKFTFENEIQFKGNIKLINNTDKIININQKVIKNETKTYPNDLSNNKILILFDVDGTLTKSRQKIKKNMIETLDLIKHRNIDIGFVGGSDLKKQIEQLGKENLKYFKYQFPENGLIAYKNNIKIYEDNIINKLGQEEYNKLINKIIYEISKIKLPVKTGTFTELRQTMLNISPIGRNCNQKERAKFEKLDKTEKIREKLIKKIKPKFKHLNLNYSIGGQISIDIFPKGWDKSFCLNHIKKDEYDKIIFIGDKTHKGGNDYEIYNHKRIEGYTTTCPKNTIEIINKVLKIEKTKQVP